MVPYGMLGMLITRVSSIVLRAVTDKLTDSATTWHRKALVLPPLMDTTRVPTGKVRTGEIKGQVNSRQKSTLTHSGVTQFVVVECLCIPTCVLGQYSETCSLTTTVPKLHR
ncbi:hypothetical protein E2C01_079608 [Portunus trituberculatus]|uniref:Secreted protein n=1 Tax=Portunus trituberculatus TaxID=210409 RepID=A0A5B7IW28_PORTR|nr:hypothetical protein [Portunus trituberculatus]